MVLSCTLHFLDPAASFSYYHCELVALHLFVSVRLKSEVRYAAWLHHCLGRQMHTHACYTSHGHQGCATLPFDDETNQAVFSLSR